ncbi:MAG: hypothetical protein QOH53_1975 [Ilumatobacteraceae bacterium]
MGDAALVVPVLVVPVLVVPVLVVAALVVAAGGEADGCGWIPTRFAAGGGSASEPHDSRPS